MAYEIVDNLESIGKIDLLKLMSDNVTTFDKGRNKSTKYLNLHSIARKF